MIEVEKSYDTAVKEKQRVQLLLESVRRRADDLERSLETANQKVEELKVIENKVNEVNSRCLDLESRLTATEKEKDTAQRDLYKCRETIEVICLFISRVSPTYKYMYLYVIFQEKDVALDKATNTIEVLERKVLQLEEELQDCVTQISRYVRRDSWLHRCAPRLRASRFAG